MPSDLNRALEQACRHAIEKNVQAIAVLPSDLPDIAAGDIAALRDALGPAPSCVIAPDTSEQGTNALALSPPSADLFRFGPCSFAAHLRAAAARGYRTQILRRPGLAHDLDTPESYRRWLQRTERQRESPDHRRHGRHRRRNQP
jgi:2-phospho-L-lactate guanylyltransferase